VIPLLTAGLGYVMLHLPQINRALWRSACTQVHLAATAGAGQHYATAAVDMIGAALVALSLAGSLYIAAGLARRVVTAGLGWSGDRLRRRVIAIAAMLACAAALAALWAVQGGFRGW
jgi:hypothetical protein